MSWWQRSTRRFFSKKDERQIIRAIRDAESQTTGEVRIHLEDHCSHMEVYDRAWEVFHELEMGETRYRNGVLIYLAVQDHKFAIIGDQRMDEVVEPGFWQSQAQKMAGHFKEGAFVEGLVEAIQAVGSYLHEAFPKQSGDINELPDDISYG